MKARVIKLSLLFLMVLGLSFPALVSAEELPLGLDVKVKDLRPDIAKSLAEDVGTQTKVLMGKMAEMFKMEITVYQIEGELETVLQDQKWPPDTTVTSIQTEYLDRTIKRLLRDSEEFEQAWGPGWVNRAQDAAKKYSDIQVKSKSIVLPPDTETLTTYSIAICTPYISMRSFDVHEGLFMIITKMEISL